MMAEAVRLTKEEWDALEPLLADADKAVHEQFVGSPESKALTGVDIAVNARLLEVK